MKPESISPIELNLEKFWLDLAKNVIESEWRSVEATGLKDKILYVWEPARPESFGEPIGLEVKGGREKYDLVLSSALFTVNGDQVEVVKGIGNSLSSDPFADLILNSFHRIYTAHQHTLCIRTFRQQRQEQLRRQKIYERRRDQLEQVKH